MNEGYSLFETPLGHCGLAWNDHGLTAVQLPCATLEALHSSLRATTPARLEERDPPASVREWMSAIGALLKGEHRDLLEVPLDMRGLPDFSRRLYEATRQILPGQTRTYGDLARSLGQPFAARAVGWTLGRNPWPLVVPCHRVLAADGGTGGFSAPGGVATKLRLLTIEGVTIQTQLELFSPAGSAP